MENVTVSPKDLICLYVQKFKPRSGQILHNIQVRSSNALLMKCNSAYQLTTNFSMAYSSYLLIALIVCLNEKNWERGGERR